MKSKARGKQKTVRPALLVLIALLLSAPTLANVLAGSEAMTDAGEHLAGAVIVAWLAVAVVGHMIDSYRTSSFHRAKAENRHRGGTAAQ
jgi:hypothetical protein